MCPYFPSIKTIRLRLAKRFQLLRAREKIGNAGHMPACASWGRNPPVIERGGYRGECDRTLVPDGPQHRQETARVVVGRGLQRSAADGAGLANIDRIAKLGPARLPDREGGLGPLGNEMAFLLSQSRIEVQHEGIGVPAELGHHERYALRHEARDERNVARQPVEL